MVKKRQGMVLDATGQRIGIATDNADGGIDVRSSIPRSQVREPVEIVWDTLCPGLANYPAIVIG